MGEKIRLESVLSQILKEMANVRIEQSYIKDTKLDEMIQVSKHLLEDMQETRKLVKDNIDHVKRINLLVAATDASLKL